MLDVLGEPPHSCCRRTLFFGSGEGKRVRALRPSPSAWAASASLTRPHGRPSLSDTALVGIVAEGAVAEGEVAEDLGGKG